MSAQQFRRKPRGLSGWIESQTLEVEDSLLAWFMTFDTRKKAFTLTSQGQWSAVLFKDKLFPCSESGTSPFLLQLWDPNNVHIERNYFSIIKSWCNSIVIFFSFSGFFALYIVIQNYILYKVIYTHMFGVDKMFKCFDRCHLCSLRLPLFD